MEYDDLQVRLADLRRKREENKDLHRGRPRRLRTAESRKNIAQKTGGRCLDFPGKSGRLMMQLDHALRGVHYFWEAQLRGSVSARILLRMIHHVEGEIDVKIRPVEMILRMAFDV